MDPRTGHEADGTRTFSNRILPRCGQCFTTLARHLASGMTDDALACEGDYGNYQPLQCKNNRCACVNIENGTVIRRGGPELNCDTDDTVQVGGFCKFRKVIKVNLEFSIDSVPADKTHEQIPLASAKCGLVKDPGHRCYNSTPKVMVGKF